MSPAEIEKRALLYVKRKNKRKSAELTTLLETLGQLPDVEKVSYAW
jgi:hypothetical protein